MNVFDPSTNMPASPEEGGVLPMGDNAQGATPNAMGGVKAADLVKGFAAVTVPEGDFCGDGQEETDTKLNPQGDTFGFLERPQGWQR